MMSTHYMYVRLSLCLLLFFAMGFVAPLAGITINQKKFLLALNKAESVRRAERADVMFELPLLTKSEKDKIRDYLNNVLTKNPKDTIEADLKKTAIEDGYGYKYANLKQLEAVAKIFNNFKASFGHFLYKITVPEFRGIPSKAIQDFLTQRGINFSERWKESIHDKQIDWNTLGKLEKEIVSLFEKAGDIKSLDTAFGIIGIDNVLKENKSQRFMVRSTGKEDTDELANAGGNKSVPNVEPNNSDILHVMGTVVASYVSKWSLEQRSNLKDPSVLELPLTPVLIQCMIGETDKFIPVSGVMFTEETEGGVSKDKIEENGKIKTSGITVIQAALGHNEGVVNSLVPVDSYYMRNVEKFYAIVRKKDTRIIPAQNHTPIQKANNKVQASWPALTSAALMSLKLFADTLENYYKKPMDVEFVVDQTTKTIYIVQARPIVHSTGDVEPASYIENGEEFGECILGSQIGVAGGAVRKITNKNQVIQASSLGSALKKYGDLENKDKEDIQVVLVEKMAPSTSHEATQFRSYRKPVLCVEQHYEKIEAWLEQPLPMLLIDMQQEMVVRVSDEKRTSVNTAIVQGWCNYPIPKSMSLLNLLERSSGGKLLHYAQESGDQINHKLRLIEDSIVNAGGLNKKSIQDTLGKPKKELWRIANGPESETRSIAMMITLKKKDLLNVIKKGNKKNVTMALYILLKRVIKDIDAQAEKGAMDNDLKNQISLIKTYLASCMNDLLTVVGVVIKDSRHKQFLFIMRFLEALIFQVDRADVVNGYSVAKILDTFRKESESIENLKKTKKDLEKNPEFGRIVQYELLEATALTPEVKKLWTDFLIWYEGVNIGKDKRDKFAMLFFSLARVEGLLPIWLHTAFMQDDKTELAKFNRLLDEYDKAKPFLEELTQKAQAIDQLKVELWQDSAQYQNQLPFLKKLAVYFTSDDFVNKFNNAQTMGKIAALSLMVRFIETFDLSIKEVEASQTPYKDKVERIHELLILNGKLLEKWVTFPSNLGIRASQEKIITEFNKSNPKQFDNPAQNALAPSQKFIVALTVLGTASHNISNKPVTLEDYFTFFHQSLLNVLGALYEKIGGTKIPMPEIVKGLDNAFGCVENFGMTSGAPQVNLFGISFLCDKVIWKYDYPLRTHSAMIDIEYDVQEKTTILHGWFFGHDEYARWERIADFVEATAFLYGVTASSKLENKAVFFDLVMPLKDQNAHFYNVIAQLIHTLGKEISYEGVNSIGNVKTSTKKIFDVLWDSLDNEKRMALIKNILKLSGKRCINFLLKSALEKLSSSQVLIDKDVITLIQTISTKLSTANPYKDATQLFLFKLNHTPSSVYNKNEALCNNYYDFTIESFEKTIKKYRNSLDNANGPQEAKERATTQYYQNKIAEIKQQLDRYLPSK